MEGKFFYYAEYSVSKKGWYVYEESEFDLPFVAEGPYTGKDAKEIAHKRAKQLNEEAR